MGLNPLEPLEENFSSTTKIITSPVVSFSRISSRERNLRGTVDGTDFSTKLFRGVICICGFLAIYFPPQDLFKYIIPCFLKFVKNRGEL